MEKKKKQIILIVILLPLMAYLIYSNVIVGMSKDKKKKTAPAKADAVPAEPSLPAMTESKPDEEGELPPLNEKLVRERERISQGEWGRDPFKPVPIKKDPDKVTGHESFRLTGTMLGGRGTAIIDGEPIGVGEIYRGYRLIKVQDTEITLEKDGQTFTLTLPEDEI